VPSWTRSSTAYDVADRDAPKRFVRAVTPPIVLRAIKRALARPGLRNATSVAVEPNAAPPSEPPGSATVEPDSPPPEWEYVPEGWDRQTSGWDGGTVAEAYVAKWPEWVEALRGPVPLGAYHEVPAGERLPQDDIAAHNMLLSFAYVLARAAHWRARLAVLDWGGGLGHYASLARAVLPEVQFEWHCREVPSVARAGASVNPEVAFHADDACLDDAYDLVLASGSLQYEVDWQLLLGKFAAATTGFLLVTRLPVAIRAPSFVVLQRAGAYGYATEYLGWVISRDELLAVASSAGLKLERELLLAPRLPPMGAPEEHAGHRGFLFRAARSGEAGP
jgi:putative methyltransferase (TIGR04325 family)